MTQLAKEILADLVAFDTTSRNSNLEIVAWIEDYLSRHGIASTRIYGPEGNKANLWATIGPKDEAGYVLSGHTDVVPVDGQEWRTNPFELAERDGRLYGRGTCDMKGFLACVLAEVPAMVAQPLKRPIHIAFSYDEEVGLLGVRHMLAVVDQLAPVKPIVCFVGEPTSMQVIVAHKSRHVYRARVHGKPCHSSLAPRGVNAIDYAAEVVLKVRDIARRLAADSPRDNQYDLPFSTAHTGLIAGGEAVNIVPEECEVAFEFRTLPGLDHQSLVDEVMAYARDHLEPQMRAIAPEAHIVIEPVNNSPGFDTAIDSEPVLMAKRLSGRNDHAKVAYGTEAGLFVWQGGIPSVVIGPGSIEQAHGEDEYVDVAELSKCLGFIDRLVEHCRA
jgi:acetylornithine deacetylase